ncbi:hypothetical protein [Sutcliffiella rhizosphaerae]|uniref:Squalene cyclase C-terminal domain-containing protein n=1 Tax=Sutcliffiella rhizosphaerae TaxID=2880967 RepID=A0ABM8YL00_9BACI|nr:hypothetical protein [Sutcliffiella rhizosphaerae]CAG9620615.1 hypothetical protein BACCIP111883_01384 [Sutcliffiella rhizosphaerae]
MAVDFQKARDYVYLNGSLWEKVLFQHLFESGSLSQLHKVLKSYKNEDNGFGHGFEYDIKCPDSHPLALEFMLGVLRDFNLSAGNIFEGTPEWVEVNQNEDGSLKNPETLLDYPFSPWWSEGGQAIPASITGNLLRHGICTEKIAERTAKWVKEHLTREKIQKTDWLFMNYHAFDYYRYAKDDAENEKLKLAAVEQIVKCASSAPENQYFTFFQFAPTPDSLVAKATPNELINKFLTHLEHSQREDGGWDDEHGLPNWQPYFSIVILHALKEYNRL